MAFVRLVPSSFMATARLMGLLAQTAGNPEQAAHHFEDALNFCRRSGHQPELAWTCYDFSNALLKGEKESTSTADKHRYAQALLEESISIAQELGMMPLLERATERVEALASPRKSAPSYPDGLTQREVEVLGLIASGKSNNDIAAELFISLRTVANHVSNILNKVGASNRTEAAIYATRQGLD